MHAVVQWYVYIVNYYTSSDCNAQFSILCSDVCITLWYTLAKSRYAISSSRNDNGQIRLATTTIVSLGFILIQSEYCAVKFVDNTNLSNYISLYFPFFQESRVPRII